MNRPSAFEPKVLQPKVLQPRVLEPRVLEPRVFEPKVVALLIAALVALFAASLLLTGATSRRDRENRAGANSYSRSAVGHLGLFDVLGKLDYPVLRSERDNARDVLAELGTNGILILAEPTRAAVKSNLLGAETILLVLPKWDVRQSDLRDEWIGAATLQNQYVARAILSSIAGPGDVVRVARPAGLHNSLDIPNPTVSGPIQLITNSKIRPIISSAQGTLLGEFKQGRRRIWVLADPDPLENHGIGKGDNLAFATAVIYAMLGGARGTLVFDETLHGFQRPRPNVLKFLFEFPFNLIALEIVIAVALLMMASVGRFGAPETPDRVLQAGKLGLISNTASLIDHAGHHAAILRRYIGLVLQETGRLLRAPRQLTDQDLAGWLDRAGAARGLRSDCAAALQVTTARPEDVVALFTEAQAIHRWRKDMINATTGRLGDH